MRLIDAEAFVKELKKFLITIHQTYLAAAVLRIVKKVINKQPTIEAKPVVHAHWFMTEYEYFDCSNCGVAIWNGCDSTAQAKQMLANKEVMFKFCPYCGAQMDEEVSK